MSGLTAALQLSHSCRSRNQKRSFGANNWVADNTVVGTATGICRKADCRLDGLLLRNHLEEQSR